MAPYNIKYGNTKPPLPLLTGTIHALIFCDIGRQGGFKISSGRPNI